VDASDPAADPPRKPRHPACEVFLDRRAKRRESPLEMLGFDASPVPDPGGHPPEQVAGVNGKASTPFEPVAPQDHGPGDSVHPGQSAGGVLVVESVGQDVPDTDVLESDRLDYRKVSFAEKGKHGLAVKVDRGMGRGGAQTYVQGGETDSGQPVPLGRRRSFTHR